MSASHPDHDDKDVDLEKYAPESPNALSSPTFEAEARRPRIQLPEDAITHEARTPGHMGMSSGLEMRREMTIEDKTLAEALHEPLVEAKASQAKDKLSDVDLTEHSLSFASLPVELDTHIDTKDAGLSSGLSKAEAAARLIRNGPNRLTPPKRRSAFMKYMDCLLTMFNILLIAAGILEYILLGIDFKANFANTYLGAILIGVAFLNAFIEFYQLQKSEAILASFLAMIPPACRVVREGELITVPAMDLVRGDVVLVRMGDKTPADLVLFAATDLKVDNSSLTGESEAQERTALPNGSKHRAVEAENLVSPVASLFISSAYTDVDTFYSSSTRHSSSPARATVSSSRRATIPSSARSRPSRVASRATSRRLVSRCTYTFAFTSTSSFFCFILVFHLRFPRSCSSHHHCASNLMLYLYSCSHLY
jgi:magnesium-transporting ATPase (P-type)